MNVSDVSIRSEATWIFWYFSRFAPTNRSCGAFSVLCIYICRFASDLSCLIDTPTSCCPSAFLGRPVAAGREVIDCWNFWIADALGFIAMVRSRCTNLARGSVTQTLTLQPSRVIATSGGGPTTVVLDRLPIGSVAARLIPHCHHTSPCVAHGCPPIRHVGKGRAHLPKFGGPVHVTRGARRGGGATAPMAWHDGRIRPCHPVMPPARFRNILLSTRGLRFFFHALSGMNSKTRS